MEGTNEVSGVSMKYEIQVSFMKFKFIDFYLKIIETVF